jgi:hypothetical protein
VGAWERPGPDGARSLSELDDAIAELAAHIDAATYRLLTDIAEFDRRQGWVVTGARSCAHWLSFRIGLELGAARDRVRVARKLGELPVISDGLRAGVLSYSKVRALTRVATPENEQELVAVARTCPASQVEKLVRAVRRVGQAELEQAQRQHERRYLRTVTDDDGMLIIEGRLPPEVGAVVQRALEAAEQELQDGFAGPSSIDNRFADGSAESSVSSADTSGRARRAADALGLVAERALGAFGNAERAEPYQVVVHVDREVLEDKSRGGPRPAGGELAPSEKGASGCCHVEGGSALSRDTARRLTCDASEVQIVENGQGEPLSVGRKTRRVSKALWRALRTRDETCAFPGCDQRGGLAVHHVTHWADGGETSSSNTILLCRRCHWLVHEGGFDVQGLAPNSLTFSNPAGLRLPTSWDMPPLERDPIGTLRCEHHDLPIDGSTNLIDYGGRGDLGQAVSSVFFRS